MQVQLPYLPNVPTDGWTPEKVAQCLDLLRVIGFCMGALIVLKVVRIVIYLLGGPNGRR